MKEPHVSNSDRAHLCRVGGGAWNICQERLVRGTIRKPQLSQIPFCEILPSYYFGCGSCSCCCSSSSSCCCCCCCYCYCCAILLLALLLLLMLLLLLQLLLLRRRRRRRRRVDHRDDDDDEVVFRMYCFVMHGALSSSSTEHAVHEGRFGTKRPCIGLIRSALSLQRANLRERGQGHLRQVQKRQRASACLPCSPKCPSQRSSPLPKPGLCIQGRMRLSGAEAPKPLRVWTVYR